MDTGGAEANQGGLNFMRVQEFLKFGNVMCNLP